MNSITELLSNIDQLHTTPQGRERIIKNLDLNTDDVIKWCKNRITSDDACITRKGKNWYVSVDRCIITINAHSFTVITAHKEKTKSIKNILKNANESNQEKTDWTKAWSNSYPVLKRYQKEVDIPKYASEIRRMFSMLQEEHGYSEEDAMLVLKDILYHEYKDNCANKR